MTRYARAVLVSGSGVRAELRPGGEAASAPVRCYIDGGASERCGSSPNAARPEATVEREATGHETYRPPLSAANQTRTRSTEVIIVAVGPEAPYSLQAALPATAKAGAKLELTVTTTRKKEFAENLAVTAVGLPSRCPHH
jgi:hypothetical protein